MPVFQSPSWARDARTVSLGAFCCLLASSNTLSVGVFEPGGDAPSLGESVISLRIDAPYLTACE